MKTILIHITLFLIGSLVLSGCYTKLSTTSSDDLKATYSEDGWLEVGGNYFYIDYTTREWFSYYGIDLATDRSLMRSAYFRYHHPTSPYHYSPFRNSYFYNYPGYSNNFFYRAGWWNNRQGFYSHSYPFFYSNPYMHNFYHHRWGSWYYWETASPVYWTGFQGYGRESTQPRATYRTSGLSTGSTGESAGNRSGQENSRLSADASDVFTVTSRDRISPPEIKRAIMNEKNIRDRRDSEYSERLNRNRSLHSPRSSRSSWERGDNSGERFRGRSVGTTRSSGTVSRTATNRSSRSSAVRGSSNTGGSSNNATRSSGSSRSSGDSSSSSR